MRELRARFATPPPADFAPSLEAAMPVPPGTPLAGNIGKLGADASTPMNPMNPMAGVMTPTIQGTELRAMGDAIAREHGIDPKLLAALIDTESGWDPLATSNKGAQGLAQLMPGTARELGVTNPLDPRQSLTGGAKYLKQMLDRFGDPKLAVAAYNAGPGAVGRFKGIPPYAETQKYVQRVMDRYGR